MILFKVGKILGQTVKNIKETYNDVIPEHTTENIINQTKKAIDVGTQSLEKASMLMKDSSNDIYQSLNDSHKKQVDEFKATFKENIQYTKNITVEAAQTIIEKIEKLRNQNHSLETPDSDFISPSHKSH